MYKQCDGNYNIARIPNFKQNINKDIWNYAVTAKFQTIFICYH